jgi:hypothetical protein
MGGGWPLPLPLPVPVLRVCHLMVIGCHLMVNGGHLMVIQWSLVNS